MSVIHTLGELRRIVRGPGISRGTRTAVVVAVAARKGGVGKTTTAVNLGAALARDHGRRVLLVDMDAQGHVGTCLRRTVAGSGGETLSQILLGRRRDVAEIARPTRIEGLWVVPSDPSLNQTESIMGTRIGKELLLRQRLAIARTHFDAVLVDCPPNLGTLTVNALVAADRVLVPCDLSALSLEGVEALLETIESVQETLNPALELLGLLRTRVDRRNRKTNEAIEEQLRARHGSWLLDTAIGVSVALQKAQHAGLPACLHDPASAGAEAYRALAAEIDCHLFGRTRTAAVRPTALP